MPRVIGVALWPRAEVCAGGRHGGFCGEVEVQRGIASRVPTPALRNEIMQTALAEAGSMTAIEPPP